MRQRDGPNGFRADAGIGATYAWTIANGTITSAANLRTITWSAGATGPVTLNVTVTTGAGCVASSAQSVTVNPMPVATITTAPNVCINSAGTASVPDAGVGAIYSWTITNGTITGGQGTRTLSWKAGTATPVTLNVSVQAGVGCATVTSSATIPVEPCKQTTDPGQPWPVASMISDKKAGSVLIYPYYTSSPSNPAAENTRFAITNISPTDRLAVHLFFVDGSNCSVADSYICLTPNQTAVMLASDIDPGVSGYVVAVVVEFGTGLPKAANCLIGDEYLKLASGHAANLGAEAIAAQKVNPAGTDLNASNVLLRFDAVNYNPLARVLAMNNIPSPQDGNSTLLIVDRIGGDLSVGAATINGLFGLLYDDAEKAYSFNLSASTCQVRTPVANLRVTPRLDSIITSGRTGWMRIYGATDIGILGVMITRNVNVTTQSNAFNQGHNLHKLTLTTSAVYTMPVFPPSC